MTSLLKYLKLDDKQLEVLNKWLESLPPHPADETCTMDQHAFNVTCYGTGIGDVFYVWTYINDEEYSVHLEYDDDGEIIG